MTEITTLTIRYERTESLPDYCNVKIGLSQTLTVPEGADAAALLPVVHAEMESYILAAIDQERERAGLDARFSSEPRYYVYEWRDLGQHFVLPATVDAAQLPGTWTALFGPRRYHVIADKYGADPDIDFSLTHAPQELIVLRCWERLTAAVALVTWWDNGDQACVVPALWVRQEAERAYSHRFYTHAAEAQTLLARRRYTLHTPTTHEDFAALLPPPEADNDAEFVY